MLVLQDPTDEKGPYLLETLIEVFRSAKQINGIFAFASSAGIRLFSEAEEFKEAASRVPIDLIVGTDAVTNVRALDALAAVASQYPQMKARAFLNPKPEGLFHPKFCFSRQEGGGCLVAGSGNLTESGLLGNWEAYSVDALSRQEMADVQAAWDSWTAKHNDSLLPLDDARVRERAALNHHMARAGDLPTLVASPAAQGASEEEPEPIQLMPPNAAVLVAEIPASGNRWKQANFDKDNYENFFGANQNRLVIFRHVHANGTMANWERSRPPVRVRSQNFRFEPEPSLSSSRE